MGHDEKEKKDDYNIILKADNGYKDTILVQLKKDELKEIINAQKDNNLVEIDGNLIRPCDIMAVKNMSY